MQVIHRSGWLQQRQRGHDGVVLHHALAQQPVHDPRVGLKRRVQLLRVRATTARDAAPVVPPPAAAAAPASAAVSAPSRIVTISSGNTLWAIARETYGDPYLYVQIFEANRDQIRDPNRIYPGQVFTLPN